MQHYQTLQQANSYITAPDGTRRYSRYEVGVIDGRYRAMPVLIADKAGFDGLGFDASVGSGDDHYTVLNLFDGSHKYIDSVAVVGADDDDHAAHLALSQFDYLGADYATVVVNDSAQFDDMSLDALGQRGWSSQAIAQLMNHPSQNTGYYLPIINSKMLRTEQNRVTADNVMWDGANLVSHGSDYSRLLLDLQKHDAFGGLTAKFDMRELLAYLGATELGFDALMETYSRLDAMGDRLFTALGRHAVGDLTVTNVTTTKPFKRQGVANVAMQFDLSDGQTFSIIFHNPDADPKKLAAGDTMVSWKWLLNKKDVTAAVSPKQSDKVRYDVIASRIMKVAAKNSKRFVAAQMKKAENQEKITEAQKAVDDKQAYLEQLDKDIAELKQQIDDFRLSDEAAAASGDDNATDGAVDLPRDASTSRSTAIAESNANQLTELDEATRSRLKDALPRFKTADISDESLALIALVVDRAGGSIAEADLDNLYGATNRLFSRKPLNSYYLKGDYSLSQPIIDAYNKVLDELDGNSGDGMLNYILTQAQSAKVSVEVAANAKVLTDFGGKKQDTPQANANQTSDQTATEGQQNGERVVEGINIDKLINRIKQDKTLDSQSLQFFDDDLSQYDQSQDFNDLPLLLRRAIKAILAIDAADVNGIRHVLSLINDYQLKEFFRSAVAEYFNLPLTIRSSAKSWQNAIIDLYASRGVSIDQFRQALASQKEQLKQELEAEQQIQAQKQAENDRLEAEYQEQKAAEEQYIRDWKPNADAKTIGRIRKTLEGQQFDVNTNWYKGTGTLKDVIEAAINAGAVPRIETQRKWQPAKNDKMNSSGKYEPGKWIENEIYVLADNNNGWMELNKTAYDYAVYLAGKHNAIDTAAQPTEPTSDLTSPVAAGERFTYNGRTYTMPNDDYKNSDIYNTMLEMFRVNPNDAVKAAEKAISEGEIAIATMQNSQSPDANILQYLKIRQQQRIDSLADLKPQFAIEPTQPTNQAPPETEGGDVNKNDNVNAGAHPAYSQDDIDYLNLIIAGDIDPLDADMDKIIEIGEKNETDPLFEQALQIISDAEDKATAGV
ncbi:hypothetical protein ACF3NV_05855 [Moraxella atlantae]|uniref:defense against restriction DarA-related protein n=1 Tax=Faucicola atlantae TaxID=34059 RepID=UPI003750B381